MASLRAVMSLMTGGYSSSINRVMRDTDRATNRIMRASGATDNFNRRLDATGASATRASGGLGKFLSLAAAIAGAVKGMNIADEYTNTAARLKLINDGLQTQAELQNKIFDAANRSRGAYGEMANAVAKMGLLAGDAFTSNDELIAFTELVQKSFKVGGADTSEQMGAMRQLSQAMASGRLQGDELVSIMENAPMLYDAISKYMGLSKGELKKLSSEGAITADIIKNAVFAAGEDINTKFAEMPITFGDVWNKIKNGGLKAFDSVIMKVNQLINADKFQRFVDSIIKGFSIIADAASLLIGIVINGWDVIGPILTIIATVWLVSIITKLWAMIPPLVAQAAAWLSIYWPILLVIAVIGLVISAARQMGAEWDEILGFIGGLIGVFAVSFYNYFVKIWNHVAAFVNFFGNVFKNPVAAVQTLFLDLTTNVLGFIEKMAKGIESLLNKIPGVNVNITSGITSLRDKLAAKSAEIKSKADLVTYVQSKEFMDYSEGWEKGSQTGKNLMDKVSKAFDLSGLTDMGKGFDLSQFGTSQNPLHVTSNDKLKVDMSDEDLKYLRDIAEREYVNKFSTATLAPNIQISFGDVHQDADADKVAGRLKQILQEEIAMAAEGSYV
jgi:tape measure domain-containing protein